MKTFSFTADINFKAKNIGDACEKLSKHFANVSESNFDMKGEFSIFPIINNEES